MTIAERVRRSKGLDTGQNGESGVLIVPAKRLPKDALLIGTAVLIATGSFGLGVVAGREVGGGKVLIEKPAKAEVASSVEVPQEVSETKVTKTAAKPIPTTASGGQYVASKTGTKYYLPWCGSVKRIKEENKVWFASKAEAEAAGYEPAKNCKGL